MLMGLPEGTSRDYEPNSVTAPLNQLLQRSGPAWEEGGSAGGPHSGASVRAQNTIKVIKC